jgi:hypothetical protein
MTLRALVFAEDALGMTLARDLCDRVVIERGPDWLADLWRAPGIRESQREWSGIDRAEPWTTWTSAKELAPRRRLATHALGMRGYSLVAYRAARLAATVPWNPHVVVLCIDTQGDDAKRAEMLDGLRKARVDDLPFALAVAHQESEAWVVAGFVPENNAEKAVLRELEAEHGFAPTQEPHRLTPNRLTDPHDAKRVCASLFPEGTRSPRAERCWLDASLDDLKHRGARTGLCEYLVDVERVVLPLLGAMVPAFDGG